MSYFITGGSGFLGSSIVEELVARGHAVTIYDRNPPRNDLAGVSWIRADLRDHEGLRKALHGHDAVLHFGAMAGITECIDNPLDAMEVNLLSTLAVLEEIRTLNIPLYFASSVYTEGTAGSIYRLTKYASEQLIADYHERYEIKYAVLRYGTLYGPFAGADNALRRYIIDAFKTKRITLEGDGDETREYIDIRDAARMTVDLLAESPTCRTYTITGQIRYKLSDIAKLVEEILPFEVDITCATSSKSIRYRQTPSRYMEDIAIKLVPTHYYDLGAGIVSIIRSLKQEGVL